MNIFEWFKEALVRHGLRYIDGLRCFSLSMTWPSFLQASPPWMENITISLMGENDPSLYNGFLFMILKNLSHCIFFWENKDLITHQLNLKSHKYTTHGYFPIPNR
jgi:hypothetical protein